MDNQPWFLISSDKKKDYVKILQAQMSDYEQALLFIDSLSRLGHGWELNRWSDISFISKYELIKNVSRNFVNWMHPKLFYHKFQFQWEKSFSFED